MRWRRRYINERSEAYVEVLCIYIYIWHEMQKHDVRHTEKVKLKEVDGQKG